jgi:hypothetical protein
MKYSMIRLLAMAAAMLTGLLLAVTAQAAPAIQVSIPFEFSFADKTFPAGDYSLDKPLPHLLVLRDSDGRPVARTFTGDVYSADRVAGTKLRFDYIGGKHVLREVWQEGDSSRQQVYVHSNEKNAMLSSSRNPNHPGGSQP